jgi:hypothetical protein
VNQRLIGGGWAKCAALLGSELRLLPFGGRALRMIPREIVAEAMAAFKNEKPAA